MSGPQEALKGLAVRYIISGTQNTVVKTPHAKSGDQETIDAGKADIKDKSLARGIMGVMKTDPHNALRNQIEDVVGKMNATPIINAAEHAMIADPTDQMIAADLIACSGMSKGTLMPIQGKRHAGKTDPLHIGSKRTTRGMTKGVATIAPTPNEGMIEDTTHKGHHRHRAMMHPEAIRKQCRLTACLSKLKMTCDVITPD